MLTEASNSSDLSKRRQAASDGKNLSANKQSDSLIHMVLSFCCMQGVAGGVGKGVVPDRGGGMLLLQVGA